MRVDAHDHMVEQIANNRWRPGEAIPTEAALASEFDMSVGTVRKAVETNLATLDIQITTKDKGTGK